MIIGITGTIGAGKSTAAEIFHKHSFEIIDCDSIGHDILDNDAEIHHKLIARYGQEIIGRDLKINREKLAEIIFNDQNNIDELNKIVHPKLKGTVFKLLEDARARNKNIVIEAAILKELELEDKVDKILVIKTEIDKVYERLKRKYTQKQIINIMNKQLQPKKYDFIVENKKSIGEFHQKIEELIRKM